MHTPQLSYAACIAALLAMPKFGQGMGLHRMLWLQEQIQQANGHPLQAIKITGSNGKGSVSAMLSSILQQWQIKHGLYTSPHLLRFNERIKINGQDISDADLIAQHAQFTALQQAYANAFPGDQMGAFEAFTAIALSYFACQQVRHAVMEVGIGGRYDPVRAIPGQLNALTSLDLDHTYLLGDTLEQIAYNKLDLCAPGSSLVLGPLNEDLLRRCRAYCQLKQVELIAVQERCQFGPITYQNGLMQFDLHLSGKIGGEMSGQIADMSLPALQLNLLGQHQAQNAAIAVLLACQWRHKFLPDISTAACERGIRQGLQCVQWPGRFEQVRTQPPVYIDVAHSPAAIDALLLTLQQTRPDQEFVLVTGVSYDKNLLEIVGKLLPVASEIICTRAYHRGAEVAEVARVVAQAAPDKPSHQAATIEEAMSLALEIATRRQASVLVAGGLFLSIEAKHHLQAGDAKQLCFF